MADNILAAFGYAPIGGLQIFGIIGGLFSKDKFIKFHAAQALAYWLIFLVLFIPFALFMSWTSAMSTPGTNDIYDYLALAVLIIYAFGGIFLLPIYYAVEAFKGKTFYIPIVGKTISGIVGYSG